MYYLHIRVPVTQAKPPEGIDSLYFFLMKVLQRRLGSYMFGEIDMYTEL